MEKIEYELVANLLYLTSKNLSNNICNDLPEALFDGWSKEELEMMSKKLSIWCNDKVELPKAYDYMIFDYYEEIFRKMAED